MHDNVLNRISPEEAKANARRIVACVNAGAGTSTEWLEGYASVIKVGDSISKNFDYLREQRDALQLRVTSLEGALRGCQAMLMESMKQHRERGDIGHAALCELHIEQAREALSPSGPQEA